MFWFPFFPNHRCVGRTVHAALHESDSASRSEVASRCSDEEGEASPRTGSWKLWLGGGTNIPSFFIYIWRRCLCPCSIKSLLLCFSAPAEDTAIHGLLMFMSYEKGGCCLGLCLQKPKDALKGTVSHWVLATWKVYIITASIESSRRIYASNEPCVFLVLHVHLSCW